MTAGGRLVWDATREMAQSADLLIQKLTHQTDQLRDRLDSDPLTGLPTQASFRDELTRAVARADRTQQLAALLFMDLDRLRVINETLGHDAGDFVLKALAERMRSCLRKMDTVAMARFESATFAIILEGIPRAPDPEKDTPWPEAVVAKRLVDSLLHPFAVGDREVLVTASIGIAISPRDGKDANVLIANAENALRRAKEHGGNTYRFFRSGMDTKVTRTLTLEGGLRRALEREEFRLHYQPQVYVPSGAVVGVEALLRWSHPEHGSVSPAEFIPVAEQSGLIAAIGEWVLQETSAQIRAWQAAGLSPVPVAVNVSASQLQEGALVHAVARILKSTGINPQYLEVEITESVLIRDKQLGRTTLTKLKDMGVRLSLDDFGTGYSSFAYLKDFPIDVLKIERSFVLDVVTDPAASAIAAAIISLGRSLGLRVVAEGVETKEQLSFLSAQGCDVVQGYLFCRPVPPEELAKLLRPGHRLTY